MVNAVHVDSVSENTVHGDVFQFYAITVLVGIVAWTAGVEAETDAVGVGDFQYAVIAVGDDVAVDTDAAHALETIADHGAAATSRDIVSDKTEIADCFGNGFLIVFGGFFFYR